MSASLDHSFGMLRMNRTWTRLSLGGACVAAFLAAVAIPSSMAMQHAAQTAANQQGPMVVSCLSQARVGGELPGGRREVFGTLWFSDRNSVPAPNAGILEPGDLTVTGPGAELIGKPTQLGANPTIQYEEDAFRYSVPDRLRAEPVRVAISFGEPWWAPDIGPTPFVGRTGWTVASLAPGSPDVRLGSGGVVRCAGAQRFFDRTGFIPPSMVTPLPPATGVSPLPPGPLIPNPLPPYVPYSQGVG